MIRTTMSDGHNVHAVTLPDIPANYPDGGSVVVTADCGRGGKSSIPARLARQAVAPEFTSRVVDCRHCVLIYRDGE